ncbi:MAG: MATE family efflux transporter [Lachnospiraceae bacterium]|nr:MATE family efflux transporter [Lachnospiraceae bacterium]
MKGAKDMTRGNPFGLLFGFAFSMMIGNVFQQLYTFVDAMIVGKYLGVTALAALGATEWLVFVMFGCVQGITQGFSISIAKRFGSHDEEELKRDMGGSILLCLVLSILFTVIGLALCKPALRLLHTPQDMIGMAQIYLRTLYGGVCISFCYNILAAFLRALGDSRTPLIAVSIASVCNIALDFLFVVILHLGVFGAASATLLSQFVSAGYCLWAVGRGGFIMPDLADFVVKPDRVRRLLGLGIPMGLQNVITGLGGVAVQSVVNSFGTIFVAGFTAANKLYGLLETAAVSYSYAVVSYTGQNAGAGDYGRVKKGFGAACVLGILTSGVMSIVMLTFGESILECFLSGEEKVLIETLTVGCTFLKILAAFFWLLYLLYIIRACVQGMGNTLLPMCSSFLQLAMRVGCAFFLTGRIGQAGVFWGEICAWFLADLFLCLCLLWVYRRQAMTQEDK